MNAYLRKEIRLLLPSVCVAMAAALGVWLIPAHNVADISVLRKILVLLPIVVCPGLVVMAALDSFGREISSNTFSNLLAQPIPRNQIWWTKVTLLAVALLAVFGVWWISFLLHLPEYFPATPKELHETFIVTIMILLCSFSGGLWSVLLLRQVGAAFWFTVIAPAALVVLMIYLTEKFGSSDLVRRNVVVTLVLYSIAGFFWAHRMFLHAQDVHWTGGNIALPAWVKMPELFSRSIKISGRRPRLALLVKEIQLHQSAFVIAGILAILHLAVRLIAMGKPGMEDAWGLKLVTEIFWGIWFIMPLLIGCTAVAEERKLGTLESQLCLPAKRRTQFVFKFGVGFVLSVVFAVIVPVIFEGHRILPDFHKNIEEMNADNGFRIYGKPALVLIGFLTTCEPILPYMPALLFAVCFYCAAFYASTMGKNTLQAIAPAILGIIIAWALLWGGFVIQELMPHPLWRGWLIYFIGVPVLTVTLVWLAWWNFKRVLVGRTVWTRNLLVFLTSLAVVICVTTAIYHRTWELFTQLEPAHGPARLTQKQGATFRSEYNRIRFQLPDGRVWSTRFLVDTGPWSFMLGNWQLKEMFSGGQFLPGTNWQSVAFCMQDVLALKEDGSLWVTDKPENLKGWRWDATNSAPLEPPNLVRYDDKTDWKSVHGAWTTALAIKQDGSLWRIGTNRSSGKKAWPGLRTFEAQRLGDDSDWAGVFRAAFSTAFQKTDGRVYINAQSSLRKKETLKLDDDTSLERAPYLEGRKWGDVIWTAHPRLGMVQVGVSSDGALRVVDDYRLHTKSVEVVQQDFQVGKKTNWVAVIESAYSFVALKADGTLWRWELGDDAGNPARGAKAGRIGTKSDWVGITPSSGGMVALSADGGLWYWKFDARYNHVSDGFQPLLRASRKPQLVGNVFARTD